MLIPIREGTPEMQAQSSAEAWLALADADKPALFWQEAAAFFKAAVPQSRWKQLANAFRKPLGGLVSRRLKGAQAAKQLPGAPDGDYIVLQFTSSFEEKKEALETVTMVREKDGGWRGVGYFVR